MLKVAVVGAAGYAGIEAVRLILGHPEMELVAATSDSEKGVALAELYPALAGLTDLRFSAHSDGHIGRNADLAFLAVPHTAALGIAPDLLAAGCRVIDLSADYRLHDAAIYSDWYDAVHTSPFLLEEAIYGLVEFNRAFLPDARLVAAPGCYPTASGLAAIPALECGIARGGRIIVDAKSGVSGAGRGANATTHYCSAAESVKPYKVASHRHTPEIEQIFSDVSGHPVEVVFTPHLVPMVRGLLSTVYMDVEPGFTTEDAVELYRARYASDPFVYVHDVDVMPSTGDVRGTNRAHIGVVVDQRTDMLIATCAIDNLVKGASGQAVQCANIMYGLSEVAGFTGSSPVV